MASAEHKQDGNDVLTLIGEQSALGAIPGFYYQVEPNSFTDASANITKKSRSPIGTRKKQRGTISGIAPKFGFNNDKTPNNLWRLLRGFLCADYIVAFTTQPLDSAAIVITSVANSDNSYNAAAGLNPLVKALIVATGFTNDGNNMLGVVTTAIGTKITVTGRQKLSDGSAAPLVDETPPAGARIDIVGVEFSASDVTTDSSDATQFKMASTVFDFTTLSWLVVGAWVFIGDQSVANRSFGAGKDGYARVKSIATHLITFDKTTFTPFTSNGVGFNIRMFTPAQIIKDVVRASEVRRYYTIERQLGNDGSGTQSEIWTDSFPDEFGVNFKEKDDVSFDLNYIPLDYQARSGTTGLVAGGHNYITGPSEAAYNTSSDIYRSNLEYAPGTTYNGTRLCFYTTDANLKVNNGGSVNNALGKVNGFSFTPGQFSVSIQVTGYLDTMDAALAERNSIDCTWDMIIASQHTGMYIDIPLVQVSGPGSNKVDADKPVTFQATNEGIQNNNNYVIQMGRFKFLPSIAMADQNIGPGLGIGQGGVQSSIAAPQGGQG